MAPIQDEENTIGRPVPNSQGARHADAFKPWHLVAWWWLEWLRGVPAILRARCRIRRPHPGTPRRIAIYSDNLDELNGISVNARILVRALREQKHSICLFGNASHERSAESIIEKDDIVLHPPRFSMQQQTGFRGSEMAVPRLSELIHWLERYRPDLIEIETPSSGGMMVLGVAHLLGIPVVSHYRTDMFAYAEILLRGRPLVLWYCKTWVRLFTRWSRPVIVPSNYVWEKLQREMNLEADDLVQLPRGIPIEDFGPSRTDGSWNKYFPRQKDPACRFIYVGRISHEKGLDFLANIWPEISRKHPRAELLLVGDGPLAEDLRRRLEPLPGVAFTGTLDRIPLAALLAEAHWFLFPSGTDTFGNAVVEALASGTPALVSDRGGPAETVDDALSGRVLPFRDAAAWTAAIGEAIEIHRDEKLAPWTEAALERAQSFSLERSAAAFWNFYGRVLEHAPASSPAQAAPLSDAQPPVRHGARS